MASKQSSKGALIATVVVALLAAAAIFVLAFVASQTNQEEHDFKQEVVEEYIPDDSLADEMKDAAARLIKDNYKALKLFYIKGLPHLDEPYGNEPEDGIYTVDIENSEYKTIEEMKELLESIYVSEVAEKVFDTCNSGKPLFVMRGEDLGIYADAKLLGDDYEIDWTGNIEFHVEPDSALECKILITVYNKNNEKVEKEADMIKMNNVWYLEDVIM